MKTLIISISGLLAISIFSSCNDNGSSSPSTSDTYLYKSYDSTGSLIAEGEFTVNHHESGELTGRWNFQQRGSHSNCGPQFGSGNLVGGIDEDIMWINLNPQMADNNCYLYGNRNRNMFSGEWRWTTFSGITNKGPFTATMK
ncbi:MAG: hypothetical protein JSW63_10795 [Ignavibacterium sp.]|nr:MAG: hypothetical protein JSW63_10795 [Ignavibacterium sp.]